jgi:hypothetical protein
MNLGDCKLTYQIGKFQVKFYLLATDPITDIKTKENEFVGYNIMWGTRIFYDNEILASKGWSHEDDGWRAFSLICSQIKEKHEFLDTFEHDKLEEFVDILYDVHFV